MIRLPCECHWRYPPKTLITLLFILGVAVHFIFSYAKDDRLEQVKYDMKASILNFFHIPTDMTIYPSKEYNVLWYSSLDLRYVIANSKKCENVEPFVLIFVKTHPDHIEERMTVRRTWGDMKRWHQVNEKHKVFVLFVLGLSKTHPDALQASLENESRKYEDLIQVDFVEDFHNLTIKLISHLKWPLYHCRDAKFWMTTDDDVFVHVGNLVTHLKQVKAKGLYSGLSHFGTPRTAMKRSKYFVPYSVYHGSYYPDYFPGAGYVLSMDAVQKLYECVPKQPLLYIDDAYVGILANQAKIPAKSYVMFRGEHMTSTDLCTLSKFITSHKHVGDEMFKLYEMILSLNNLDPNVLCWGKLFSWINPNDIVFF